MAHCITCDRWFDSYNDLEMHIDYSEAHRYPYGDMKYEESKENYAYPSVYVKEEDWACEVCRRNFSSEHARLQHFANTPGHPYCFPCKRMFVSEHNLTQVLTTPLYLISQLSNLSKHLHSKIHMGRQIECPFCKHNYTIASGLTIHLESGSCESGLDRRQIKILVRLLDHGHVITRSIPNYPPLEMRITATAQAWNGRGYQCYLCSKEFTTLDGLNSHLKSPVHEEKLYHCPQRSCGREYKVLSGLVAHVESESCGLMPFLEVQRQAALGVSNMVGKMISG